VAENQDVRSMVGPAEQLAARYAEYAPAHTLLAQVYRVAGRIDDSIHALDRSLELDPEQANVHEMAGQMELSQERFDNALAHFSQAAGMEPRETKYQLFIAQVYIVQQQYDQARQLLLRALALDSSQHKAYAMLSDLYARQNKTDLALDQMQKAIDHTSISERDMQVVYIRNKSRLLRRANKPSDALLALEALSAEESADMAVVEEIATCWAMMGEFATAAEIYEEGFFHNHNDFELLERAAAWRIKAGDTDRAAKYLEIIRRNDPRSPAIADLEEQLAEPRTR
jgi:tetratricopeptide (TPR) repeat protein